MSLGSQVEVLRLVQVFLDLLHELGHVQLSSRLRRKVGAIVQVVEKVLTGIPTRRRLFGESVKYIQLSLCGLHLMEASDGCLDTDSAAT